MDSKPVNFERFKWNGPGWYRFVQLSDPASEAVWYEDEDAWNSNAEWAKEDSTEQDPIALVYLGNNNLPDDGSRPAQMYQEEVDLWYDLRREDDEDE